ncbi:MAG TPA: transglycosylase domain-containing protein [Gaiellaceae bacterium]|nr:transglycosylase domain-containing protein [Gaiellaceae bacterium]
MGGPNGGNGNRRGRGPRADLELERLLAARHARRRRTRRRHRSVLLLLAMVVAASVTLVVATVAFTGPQLLSTMCSLKDLRPLSLGSNSFLYADNGTLLGVVPSATNRQPLPLTQISPWLPEATVAIEDARFWEHGALDYQGILRAIYEDVTAGQLAQGASTLTQQLVRNLYIGNPQRTFSRKFKEACLSEKLFQKLSRKQILAAYLNEVFYGRHAYGAQAAAQTYFSKSAKDLTLSQAALLAGLPQAPTTYDPVVNPQYAIARRNQVLRAMLKNGYITRPAFRQALRKPLGLRLGHLYTQLHQPNFFGWATQQLVDKFGEAQVERGGLKVKTTLDPRLQALALRAVSDALRQPTDPAAALVSIDPRTGAVKAMVDYLPDHRRMQFNLATQAHRSTGSAFKPITLATALTEGVSLYSTFYGPPELYITDPQCATNGGPWDVHNSGDESAGTVNLISATAGSINTIFAQLIAKVGVANTVKMAHWLGITTPSGPKSPYFKPVCAITLGSVGFTPLELTDVYATLASGGIHHAPAAFTSVRGPKGKPLPATSPGRRILSSNVDAEVTYALEGVISSGTGTAANIGRPAAGKTGTAENYQDAWFCGYTPQLATCVWIGYPKGEIPILNVEGFGTMFGGDLPAEIWHNFMAPAVAPYPPTGFPTPVIGGTLISGTGTYSYAPYYSPYSTTTTTTPTTTG